MTRKHFVALGLVMSSLVPSHAAARAGGESGAGRGPPSVETARPASTGLAEAPPPQAKRGTLAEEKEYAERESASPDAKDYEAGQPIVIGATTVAIVLLVVIILILI
jgi:hypothetical protein